MPIKVTLFFVNIGGFAVADSYYACGDANTAGPFMSGGSAIEWRDVFAPGAEVFSALNTDPGVCQPPALMRDTNGWHRG